MLKWPNGHALVGYVGLARIGKKTTSEWLYDFIGRHPGREPSADLSKALVADLERDLPKETREQRDLTLHLGTFEIRDSLPVPQCWYIRNLDSAGRPKAGFEAREELFRADYLGRFKIEDVHDAVAQLAKGPESLLVPPGRRPRDVQHPRRCPSGHVQGSHQASPRRSSPPSKVAEGLGSIPADVNPHLWRLLRSIQIAF